MQTQTVDEFASAIRWKSKAC